MEQCHLVWKRGVGSHFTCPGSSCLLCSIPVLAGFSWPQLLGGSNSMNSKGLCYGRVQTEDFSASSHCEIFSKQINPRKNLLLVWRCIRLALSVLRCLPIPRGSMFQKISKVNAVVNRWSLNIHLFSTVNEINPPEASVSVSWQLLKFPIVFSKSWHWVANNPRRSWAMPQFYCSSMWQCRQQPHSQHHWWLLHHWKCILPACF